MTAESTGDPPREEHLRESEPLFRLLLGAVKDYAIFMLDPAGRIVSWNMGAQRIKGYTAEEIVGQHFSRFYTAGDVAAGKPDRELQEARATGRFEEEGLRVRKDGSTFWASVVISPIFDEGSRLIGFAKVTRDITERKGAELQIRELNWNLEQRVAERTRELERALAQRDLLLKEVHHRVKNNLQTIQSIVRLAARRASAESQPTFADVERRIWAIGQLYNQVYLLGELSQVSLQTYLERICRYSELFGEERDIGIDLDLEPVQVTLDSAGPIGLIVVELLTNAYKHAFPDGRKGRIEVKLRRQQGRAELIVSDNGIGMDSPDPSAGSMGMTLVRSLSGQIGGTLDVSSGPGTRWTVSFPILEPPA